MVSILWEGWEEGGEDNTMTFVKANHLIGNADVQNMLRQRLRIQHMCACLNVWQQVSRSP